jgi:glycosyltransferase involved in cell wall biosynthesis
MKPNCHIVAWQPVLTDHQAFTFAELSKQADVPLIAYVKALEDSTRQLQGWVDTCVSSVERRLIPDSGSFRYCHRCLLQHRHDVHLFCSPFQDPILIVCLLIACLLRIEFYLISEPYCPVAQSYFGEQPRIIDRLKAIIRPALYRIYVSVIKNRVQGIFAISKLALRQYSLAGIPADKLFPFGYFIPALAKHEEGRQMPCQRPEFRVVFVGSLIARKGLDILIEAMRLLCQWKVNASLDVFGPGSTDLFALDTPNVRYCGQIPFGLTQETIKNYELLVLPSRYDGWGVVINEALIAGVPVVCSDRVGAGLLIEKFLVGASFTSGCVHNLASCIAILANDRALLASMKHATLAASLMLQPSVAASYMLKVMLAPNGEKALVTAPWYPY